MARNVKPCKPATALATKQALGWKRGDGTNEILVENPKLGAKIIHVNICEDDKILYDQPLRCEVGGGVFMPIDQMGRIGLQKAWRPQTKDQAAWKAEYPKVDVTKLGRDSWELPRGFANVGESGSDAAKREAEEETQSMVVSAASLGEVNDNTTFSPHMTAVQIGSIDQSKKSVSKADPNEKLVAPLTFFTLKEIKEMVGRGEIYDAYTLSAMGLYYIQLHGN